jgi:hypothetical protein
MSLWLSDFGKTEYLRICYLNSLSLPTGLVETLWEFTEPTYLGMASVSLNVVKADFTRDLVIIGNQWFLNCKNHQLYIPDVIEICAISRSSIERPLTVMLDTVSRKPYIISDDKRIFKIDRKKMDLIEIPFFSYIMQKTYLSKLLIQDGFLIYNDGDSYLAFSEDGQHKRFNDEQSKSTDDSRMLSEDIQVVYYERKYWIQIREQRVYNLTVNLKSVPNVCIGDEFFFFDSEKTKENSSRLRMKFL